MKKYYIIAGVGAFIIGLGLIVAILRGVSAWFDVNRLVFKKPVEVTFNKPVSVEERKVEVAQVVQVMQTIPHPDDLETDIELAIYEKWGIADYKVAIAIAKSESGLKNEAFNVNTNGSIDVSIFQINSVHFKKEGCSLEEVTTVQGNIDCAYSLWLEQSWNPWVVFQTGAFKNKL
jgi:hypothetical protein